MFRLQASVVWSLDSLGQTRAIVDGAADLRCGVKLSRNISVEGERYGFGIGSSI